MAYVLLLTFLLECEHIAQSGPHVHGPSLLAIGVHARCYRPPGILPIHNVVQSLYISLVDERLSWRTLLRSSAYFFCITVIVCMYSTYNNHHRSMSSSSASSPSTVAVSSPAKVDETKAPSWQVKKVEETKALQQISLVTPDGNTGSIAQFWSALASDASLRRTITDWMIALPFTAIAFETPLYNTVTASSPMVIYAIDHPGLVTASVRVDSSPFTKPLAEYKKVHSDAHVAVFPSLGRDSQLIVPYPSSLPTTDGAPHLLAFLRIATAPLIDQLWYTVATTVISQRVSVPDRDMWISTAGMGVIWLHVRIDDRPKYYSGPLKVAKARSTEQRFGRAAAP